LFKSKEWIMFASDKYIVCGVFAITLLIGGALPAQDRTPREDAPAAPPTTRQENIAPARPGRGLGGRIGMMRGGGLFAGNQLEPYIAALADVNLSPEFNLSVEQKRKIAAIRQDFRKSYETWQKDHSDQMDDLVADWRDMRNGGAGAGGGRRDMERMRELMLEAQDLNMSAPSGEEAVDLIKAVLTEEQLNQVNARQEQLFISMERRRLEMGAGWSDGPRPFDAQEDREPRRDGQSGQDDTADDAAARRDDGRREDK
jgi:hypothetical protein